jgi:hypothetical protein
MFSDHASGLPRLNISYTIADALQNRHALRATTCGVELDARLVVRQARSQENVR